MNAQITETDILARAFDLLEDGKTYSAADLQALRERAEAELRGERSGGRKFGFAFRPPHQ